MSTDKTDKKVLYWRGKIVDTLTREELLQAVHNLAQELERERNWNTTVHETDKAIQDAAKTWGLG